MSRIVSRFGDDALTVTPGASSMKQETMLDQYLAGLLLGMTVVSMVYT